MTDYRRKVTGHKGLLRESKMKKVVAIQTKGEYSREIIEENCEKVLAEFGTFQRLFKPGEKVLVKPNLVAPSEKAATDMVLLEYVLRELIKIGAEPIVAESSGFEFSTGETFRILKVDEMCNRLGVRLVNLDLEKFEEVPSGNPLVPSYKLPEIVFQADKIINMPRLKGHSLTKVTFSIKNLFGLLHRESRRKIHATNLELGISYLKNIIPVDFVIVDGLWNLTNAVYSNASYQGIILAGDDMTAVDYCCCKIFGIDYKTIPHIYNAEETIDYEYKMLSTIEGCDNETDVREKHFKRQNRKYKAMYIADLIFSGICKKSIIPYIHYYLGIRPCIDKSKCNDCGKCKEVCPANAIDHRTISAEKCMRVRCLKCYEICPVGAVGKKGFHK